MSAQERILRLENDDTPETGVIFDTPGIEGMTCYKIVVGGRWRGEGKMLDRDCDEEAVGRLWAQLDDCKRRDAEAIRVSVEAHHFPSQMTEGPAA